MASPFPPLKLLTNPGYVCSMIFQRLSWGFYAMLPYLLVVVHHYGMLSTGIPPEGIMSIPIQVEVRCDSWALILP